jgi:hypothetical protein
VRTPCRWSEEGNYYYTASLHESQKSSIASVAGGVSSLQWKPGDVKPDGAAARWRRSSS